MFPTTIIKKIIPLSLRIFLVENRFYVPLRFKSLIHQGIKDENVKVEGLPIYYRESWIKKFRKYSYAKPEESRRLSESFFCASISIVKPIDVRQEDILVICVQKNDVIRIKKFITYHRDIGVKKFVILDNDSTDGSFEWLKQQEDVFLLQTKDSYSTIRREAWINRIFAYFGYNRWYVVLDSDELLSYEDFEHKMIVDVISYLTINNVKRGKALLLDMYAKPHFYEDGKSENYYEECKYFDTDSYYAKRTVIGDIIQGGPRMRCFGTSSFLMKYPLVYLEENDLQCSSHYLFPYKKNHKSNSLIFLRHYKFLPGDFEKYIQRYEEKSFSSGSDEYEKYVRKWEKTKLIDFFYQGTAHFDNSLSLKEISVL